ncbi:LytR/AlgR family response regulator transcription factor [Roseibium alexandrii]|uniref:Response regulator of the LytR/AlgR family n=1 Tax=Roseibium alexandrii (strain DSM 17067 / NCIMB 14079 / DFL-11) TaxID=244592 RepID=A0A5E8H060_ROSAD|nr:LytTR family DNA-binding domain-containing protein [Roseibium alexandrii]EEE45650.2 Response regulator of the LytR/AlgR family [Roseibium alexandrii DFL-11]
MLRLIVVDDEPPARRLLSRMCASHDDVEVVGAAANLAEASSQLKALSPDAVFLDINLGQDRPNGFALLDGKQSQIQIVFVTAHADHAVQAFDHGAVDYLLKPVEPDRLKRAIDRLRLNKLHLEAKAVASDEQRVTIRVDGTIQFLVLRDIAMLQAEGDYTRIHLTHEREILVSKRLGQFEADIEHPDFVRISRFLIMNRAAIRTIRHAEAGKQAVTLKGQGEPITVGRAAARRLRAWSKQ